MAPTIGQKLRQAREERGAELSDVEVATKIRVKFLEAMEEDRWGDLPAPVYARGFLDIYARHLGLDQQALLDEYRQTVEGERHEPIPQSVDQAGHAQADPPGAPHPARSTVGPVAKVVAGLLVLVVVGLVIVGLIGGSDEAAAPTRARRGRTTGPRRRLRHADHDHDGTTPADEVSVELRATAPVWVCLVDDSGTPVVDSETLSADESRGPFSAGGFDVTFGQRLGRDDGRRPAGGHPAGRRADRLPDHPDRCAEARPVVTADLSVSRQAGAIPNAINPIG